MSSSFRLSRQLVYTLVAASFLGVVLFGVGVLRNQTLDYWYLPYNLALACIPLLLAGWLQRLLKKRPWNNWLPVVVTILWVLFLPNSFYVVSDFIHVNDTPRVDIVGDVVMLAQFSFVAMILGFISLFIVQGEVAKRWGVKVGHVVALGVLFLSSFAIYLGRDLRWNSWDVVVQPLSLTTDIWMRILHPFLYPSMINITLGFFVLLSSMYTIIWAFRNRRMV